MENKTMEPLTQQATFITPDAMLAHWQGHRRLTRKMIAAFPEDKLFTYSVGGMRPFAELAMEMVRMGAPSLRGIVVGEWQSWDEVEKNFPTPANREELLKLWDRATEQINSLWPLIAPERFREVVKLFGQWEGPVYWSVLYLVDNEIHHRGQGYVYLRSLGITPPPFWER
ncbi:MAG: DinB family protein [Chryseosolibacter sp.]